MPALFDSGRVAGEPRVCPYCQGPMALACIKPSLVGFEVRTYAGTNCDHLTKWSQRMKEVGLFGA